MSGTLKLWTGTEWASVGPIEGVQGPEGPEGPVGAQGPEGPEGPEGAMSGDVSKIMVMTEAEYDALPQADKDDPSVLYVLTDA